MEIIVTALFMLALIGYGLYALFRADRRAKAARERAAAAAERRRAAEREALERLQTVKEQGSGLKAAKNAIEQDPKRAARAVAAMMKK